MHVVTARVKVLLFSYRRQPKRYTRDYRKRYTRDYRRQPKRYTRDTGGSQRDILEIQEAAKEIY